MAATTASLSKGAAELLRNAVVVKAAKEHTATLLFLHGLGDTGYESLYHAFTNTLPLASGIE